MTQQLKQALMNAGVISQKDIEREKVKAKHLKGDAKMHQDQIRIVCDVCLKSAPDVERYRHTNKMLGNKEWFCIPCADQNCVSDDCRITGQSSQAKAGMFRRQYGRTKKI